jgi:hypothetical protein
MPLYNGFDGFDITGLKKSLLFWILLLLKLTLLFWILLLSLFCCKVLVCLVHSGWGNIFIFIIRIYILLIYYT